MERNAGNLYADVVLGEIYRDDWFNAQNEKLALKHYLLAASNGLKSVSLSIASMYEQGSGAKRNLPEALNWYEKAANDGWLDPDGQITKLKALMANQ
ncbi:hypothetical protein [Maritalea sp.]|uniref:hypothetical protein n=1 Tax=Maritalea sp. TaxID=2003361 RepID=UPI003EF20F45